MTIEQQICSSLINMMETTPYYKIKVSNFVAETGISRSSFYFYFNSIYSVLEKIEDDFIKGISDEYTAVSRLSSGVMHEPDGEMMLRSTVHYISKNLRLIRILSGPNGDPNFQYKLSSRARKIGEVIYRSNGGAYTVEKKLLCECMAGAQWYMYRWWARHENEVDEQTMVKFIQNYIRNLKPL